MLELPAATRAGGRLIVAPQGFERLFEQYGNEAPRVAKKKMRPVQRRADLAGGRGFACVALDRPADPVNVGHVLRAALCFQARMIILGQPSQDIDVRRLPTDPTRAYRHVPVIAVDDLIDAAPRHAALVAVEILPDAVSLPDFVHPERACYIFGPESGAISDRILQRSDYRLHVPTVVSLNLGMTVGIVLYDRCADRWRRAAEDRGGRVSAARSPRPDRQRATAAAARDARARTGAPGVA